MTRRVYLDVDTGLDDALALLLAVRHPALDVRGVSTVVGNVDLDQVTRNTLQVLDIAGAPEVPVARGADRPLVAPARSAAVVHGDDGLGGAALPPPSRGPTSLDAVDFLSRALRAETAPVTLIALGPLTNIALLLRNAPDVRQKIERLAIMGGAVEIGNATPVAEFNIYHDPEAADIVFRAGIPILMYGLEVFRRLRFDAAETDLWFGPAGGAPRTPAALAGHILHFMMRNFDRPDATIGDAGTVAAVIDGRGLTTERFPVAVETGGRHSRGQTIVDRRHSSLTERRAVSGAWTPVDVALDIDVPYYRRLFRDQVGLA